MPNHFHILATPLVDDGLSQFMQKLATAYAMYFNKKYKRTGSLFEGKFKSQHANDDRYPKYLFSYIHLNPVKLIQSDWKEVGINNQVVAHKYLQEYHFSSYLEMMGHKRKESRILNSEPFPNYYDSFSRAEKEVREWLAFSA
ncbi:hypothetical protein CL638_00695 [bacterium]|nr:hypothetical protein [bacterium]